MATDNLTHEQPVFLGSVDHISTERVYGWLSLASGGLGRAWVSVVVKGITMRSGVADLYREDLREAGIADGCAGYDFVFAQGEIPTGSTVSVYGHAGQLGEPVLLADHGPDATIVPDTVEADDAEPDALETNPITLEDPAAGPLHADIEPIRERPRSRHAATKAFAVAPPPPPPTEDGSSGTVCVHIDVTDLLFYLWHFRNVSGIQRVQCGYIANLMRRREPGLSIRFCISAHGRDGYVDLPPTDMRYLMQELHSSRIVSYKDWQTYVGQLRDFDSKAPSPFQPDDILLVMGAPWVYPDYFRAVQAAKRDYGIRYFQISYDMIPSVLPEHCDAALVVAFNRAIAGMLRYADHVFAISNYSATDFIKLAAGCGVPVPPVSVIPMGGTVDYNEASSERERVLARGHDRALDGFFKTNKLDEYVLFVSTLESRKNHSYLYQVWKRLLAKHGHNTPKLVLVGRLGWHIESLQRYLKISNWLNGRIVHLTEVSDRELQELYARALFTVFPSLYEGWGLPVGESLYYGKLPVTSNTTSMPEVGGEWAVYIDPFNTDDGYKVIDELVSDRPRLAMLEQRIASDYVPMSWNEAADKFLVQLAELAWLEPSVPERGDAKRVGASKASVGGPPLLEMASCYEIVDFIRRAEAVQAEVTIEDEFRVLAMRELLDGDDWHDAESWGCWARGDTARLGFRVATDAQRTLLAPGAPRKLLAYVAVCLPGYYPDTPVTVTVNGVASGRPQIVPNQRTRHLRIVIDPALIEPDDTAPLLQIAMALDQTIASPSAGDIRLIGLGVKSIFLCFQEDFEARLSYLEDRSSS